MRAIGSLALIVGALIAPPAMAGEGFPSEEQFDGNRIIIIDGDTVALPCKAETGFQRGCAAKIRFKDIDTPEVSHPSCDNDLAKGLEAKARLRELISGETVTVKLSGEKDRYGRFLGWLLLGDGSDVGSILLQEGLAVHWTAGARAKAARIAHWCGVVSQ